MNESMEKELQTIPGISGFRDLWNRMGRMQRYGLKEAMGFPAKGSLNRWLDAPGTMKVSTALSAIKYLNTQFENITMKSLTETK